MSDKIKFDVFLKGELINLVCLDENVVEKTNWYNWFNDEDNMRMMQQHFFPNTRAQELKYFKEEIENNRKRLQLGIVHKKDNLLIGVISLSSIDMRNRRCEISGFLGEKEYHNVKNFIEANQLLIKHAFDNLNIHKIYGGTLIKEVSIMYCRILGFKQEGIKEKEIYKNGRYYDIYVLGLLKEDYDKFVG